MRRIRFAGILAGILLASLTPSASAQDAKTVVDNAMKAMGAQNLGSIRYTATGLNFALGQAPNPSSPWPRFNVKSYERIIDFDAGATSQTMVRTQAENPPRGGGQQPIIGERNETQTNGMAQPWAQKCEMWMNPIGFLKGAAAATPAIQTKTVGTKKYNVVSYTVDNKYKVNGYLDDQNMVAKVE